MKTKYIMKGILKSIPGIEYLYHFNKRTGGSCSARYCYSIWLRHLVLAYKSGFTSIPKTIAELGPGDSLGTGLIALISGAEKYYALDVKKYSNEKENLKMFDDLVILLKQKTNIPDDQEFPRIRPLLDDYSFPTEIFSDNYLKDVLNESRLARIRKAIEEIDSKEIKNSNKIIEYKVPWNKEATIEDGTVDMVFSQAVLQAADDLESIYKKIAQWLKPNGFHSHDIGFISCGSANTWFGHWEYSDIEWKIVRGRKNFYINREPYSTHQELLRKNNFDIILEKKHIVDSNIDRNKLAPRFKNLSKADLSTYSVFFQAKKLEY